MAANPRSNRSFIVGAVLLAAIAAAVWLLRGRIHFDWHSLGLQLRSVSIPYVLAGVAIIYFGYWLRALRWAVMVSPVRRTKASELLGSQLVGFTAVVLVGRLADLVRPYLTAKRLSLPVAGQLAIYSMERAFDLGAAAILFSFTLAIAPANLPHHAAYVRAGVLSLVATVAIAAFATALRFAGGRIAALTQRALGPFSKGLGERAAERVLDFQQGFQTISTLRDFLAISVISVVMWAGIALAYLMSARAFQQDPVLSHLSFTATMLLLATSLGGSLVQLPVLGWFTQIAVVGAALDGFFGVPLETATACAAVVFFVLNLDVVPAGLIAARLEGTTLREAVTQSSAKETASIPQLS